MTDTIAVACIAVAGTLGSGALSYLASRSSTKAQLEGVRVEIFKLQRSHDEEARQEKVTVYYEYLTAAENLERFYRGLRGKVTPEQYKETFNEFTRMYNRLLLIGDEAVVDAAENLQEAVKGVTKRIVEINEEHPAKERWEKYAMAISEKGDAWKDATHKLQEEMRKGTQRSR
jgi:hypothetical protein